MTISRFDAIIWSIAALLASITLLVILLGNQVGLDVLQAAPGFDAATVSTKINIQVTFSDDLAMIPNSAITFSPPVSGTTSIDGNTLTFQPLSALQPNADYQVILSERITGENGRRLKENMTWQFRTTQPQILFIKPDENDPDQIFVADPSGTAEAKQLSQSPSPITAFAVSPDSSRIAYSASTHEFGQEGTSDIWLMNSDGSDARMLLDCSDAVCGNLIWMPDSRRLIYERRQIPSPGAAPGNPRLFWLDVLTEETVPLFADNQILGLYPAISPDGEWLSFVSPLDNGIQLYSFEDGSTILIPNRMGSAVNWSPDSQTVALADVNTEDQDWGINLSLFNVDTETVVNLGESVQTDEGGPVWSPDGRQIVFGSKMARTGMGRQIWLMGADSTDRMPLTNEPDFQHTDFAWSPDGQSIIYQRYDQKELYATPSVWILDIQSGQTEEIATPATQPAWLP